MVAEYATVESVESSAIVVAMTTSLTFIVLAALLIIDTLRSIWAISKTTISHVRFGGSPTDTRWAIPDPGRNSFLRLLPFDIF